MKTLSITLLAALAVASSLPAQTKSFIYPRDHAAREGSSNNGAYHITAGICRFQYSYESWNMDIPKGAKIIAFGYRQDGYYANRALKVQFEALMGHNSRLQESLTNQYSANYDSTPTTVIAKKIFNLPAMPKPLMQPSKTFLMLKLDKAFAYQSPKNLVTEIKVYNNSNGNKTFNYYMDFARYYSPAKSFGLACKTSGSTLPTLTSGSAVLKGNWRINMSNFPGSSPSLLILGGSKTKLLGAIKLPFKLDALGMPSCYQNVDVNLIMAGPTTNTGGSASVSFPVPLNFKLMGQKIYAQMWAADIFANKAGLVTSNGVEVQFGSYPREHMVWSLGTTTNKTGYQSLNYGTVARFDCQ